MTAIKNWSEDDRPREKLLLKGVHALSNSELLAILINNSTKDKSAVDLAKELLHKIDNNLHKLSSLGVQDMLRLKVKGLGPAKAISIAAALELGSRRVALENKKDKITSGSDIAAYLQAQLQYHTKEVFVVVFLNAGNRVLHHEVISEGGITGTVVDSRIVLRKALEQNATAIILCHNHPSGNLKPSKQDEQMTQRIKQAAAQIDIAVLDHLIVSNEGYYSFAEEGLM